MRSAHSGGRLGVCGIAALACAIVAAVTLPARAPNRTAFAVANGTPGGGDLSRNAPHLAKGRDCSTLATLTTCVLNILAPGGGTRGVYLQQVGGSVLAQSNSTFRYEPASSIKPVIALYAIEQVEHGHARLTDLVPKIGNAGGPGDCPPATIVGTERLGTALGQMLQVSDNNRTRELMQHFGVSKLNAFAASLGLTNTMFQTSPSPPGFNTIGCLAYGFDPLPATVDGNTMTLADAAKLWSNIAALPVPYASEFYQLAAGRDMQNTVGYDFTGVWPAMAAIAANEAPAGLSAVQLDSFEAHAGVSVKGGDYHVFDCPGGVCTEATWAIFEGVAEIPSCVGTTMKHTNYLWGYFISDAVGPQPAGSNPTAADIAFNNASGELLAAPIAQGLKTWKQCGPVAFP
ncbi:MAG TPA: serine hydrolase, partial [Acidimicrobiia bacterium]|nr:serine hydrolase [Acidimicrobiia bacterium]